MRYNYNSFLGFVMTSLVVCLLCTQVLTARAITRSEILKRAQIWVDKGVKYSQSDYTDGYRQDCSGFVSYAWATLDKNSKPISYTTDSITSVCNPITKDDLKAGDVLLNQTDTPGHVLLFEKWTDDKHTKYMAYDMANEMLNLEHREIPYAYWTDFHPEHYSPYRYKNVTDDTLTDYYVDTNGGNDGNTGNSDSPLKTLSKALNLAGGAQVTIHLRAGTYNEPGVARPLRIKTKLRIVKWDGSGNARIAPTG